MAYPVTVVVEPMLGGRNTLTRVGECAQLAYMASFRDEYLPAIQDV